MTHSVRALTALAAAVAIAALAGCAPSEPDPAPTTATPTVAVTATPTPSETPTEAPAADPACDTIIPGDVAADFENAGLTSQTDVFRIGPTEIPGGLWCRWGDANAPGDHVQIFGWAPLDPSEASQYQSTMVQEGWLREDDDDSVYLTEDPDTAAAVDDDGYGWTYQFGDGWVKFADTKQGLLLIDWPPAD
ncbi:MAG: hypothetical protein QM611_11680 [Microbacterium sp.]|uniref:hypothetical protein n=1 Tax=Microbacterium sp. TaxID=51671 RepID=UPI0039E323D8